MAIFRKAHLSDALKDLNEFYDRLRTEVEGFAPQVSEARLYGYGDDHQKFLDECTNLNHDQVERCIAHFKASVDSLKKLRGRHLKPQSDR